MDFVFGKLINDELKLTHHRASRSGIQHQHRITPADPTPTDNVTVHFVTSSDFPINGAALYYTTNGSAPIGSRGASDCATAVKCRVVRTEWDNLIWDYLRHWEAEIPAQPDQTTVTYTISGWNNESAEFFADHPDADERLQHAAMVFFNSLPKDAAYQPAEQQSATQFTYHVDRLQPPNWSRDAIIYQIFLDRFYPGHGKSWRQTSNLNDFCGGTLWGVRDKLDYLAELGINCLWLSPTWKSPSNHGYDIANYDQVEPRLGGEEALRAVIDGARQRGIRVLLDLVCNHISDQHPIFQDALAGERSPYRNWFDIDDVYVQGYRSFFNVKAMPELNLEHPEAREWMIDNAVNCLRKFDVDGFRLDYANGAGPDFWAHFRPRVKAIKPDCLLLGEIIDSPNRLRVYQGRLDGCLDFTLNDALRKTYAWKTWDQMRFDDFMDKHPAFFDDSFVMPSFLDNHDMDRFSFVVNNSRKALKRALAAQMKLANPPIIFYGTEVGLRQIDSTREKTLDVSRVPMV